MGGINIQRFFQIRSPHSFAHGVVTRSLSSERLAEMEAALGAERSEAARDLSHLLGLIREGKISRDGLAEAERAITALAHSAIRFDDTSAVAQLEEDLALRDQASRGEIYAECGSGQDSAIHPRRTRRDVHQMSAVSDATATAVDTAASNLITGATLAELAEAGFAKIQSQMRPIPGGTFQVGYNGADAFENEGPAHMVTVFPFQMQQNDVTNAQYKTWVDSLGRNRFFLVRLDERGWPQVMAMGTEGAVAQYRDKMKAGDIARMMGEQTADHIEFGALQTFVDANFQIWGAEKSKPYNNFDNPNQPANVTWNSAYLYAFMHGSRLPTRAEFEFAASEGGRRITYDPAQIHTSHQTQQTTTVKINASRPVNGPYGLSDIMGNVLKWLMDWHGPYSTEEQINPTGAPIGDYRELGGVSWSRYVARGLRVSPRDYGLPGGRSDLVGFRLVRQDSRE